MRSEIKFYRSYWEAATMLSDPVERCQYYDMIFQYAFEGAVEPPIEGTAGAMFTLTKPTIDSYIKKSEAGAKGGASKPEVGRKQTASKPQANRNDAPTYVNDNVNVNDNVYVKEKEKEKIRRFAPPTPQEVQAYCDERNNGISGEYFVDYYATRGWKIKGQTMNDWKAAVRTWERNGYSAGKAQPQTFTPGQSELDAIRNLERLRDRVREDA